jgi:hypothetical protein
MEQYKINKYIHKFQQSGNMAHLSKMIYYKNQYYKNQYYKNMIGGALNQADKDKITKIHNVIKSKCQRQTKLAYMDIDAKNISNVVVNKLILSELIDTLLLKPKIRFHNIMKDELRNGLDSILEREYIVDEEQPGTFSIKTLIIHQMKFIGFNVDYFDLYPTFSYFCNRHIDNMKDSFLLVRLKNIIDKMINEFISKYTASELKLHIKDNLKKLSTNMCATVENYSQPQDTYSENKRIIDDQKMRIIKINKLKYVYTIIDDEMIKINTILKNNIDFFLHKIIDTFIKLFRNFNKEQAVLIKEYIVNNDELVSLFIDGFIEVDVGIETEQEIYNQILNIDERVNDMIHMNMEVYNHSNNKKNEFDIVIGKFDRINKIYDIATIIDIKHSAKLIIDDAEKFDMAITAMNRNKDVLLHYPRDNIIYKRDEYSPNTFKGYIYKVPFNHSTSVYILLNMMTEFVKQTEDNNIIMNIFNIYTEGKTTEDGNYMIDIMKYRMIDNMVLNRYNEFMVQANAKLNKIINNFAIFHCDIKTPGEKFQPYAYYMNDNINMLYRQQSTDEIRTKRQVRLERLIEEQTNEYIEGIKKSRIPILEPEFTIDPDFF